MSRYLHALVAFGSAALLAMLGRVGVSPFFWRFRVALMSRPTYWLRQAPDLSIWRTPKSRWRALVIRVMNICARPPIVCRSRPGRRGFLVATVSILAPVGEA
jgi:hypothetical protein